MNSCVCHSRISPRRFEHCLILFIITLLDNIHCLDSSDGAPVYTTSSCHTLNTTAKIPCTQHLFIQHSKYCQTDSLKKLFPHLYSTPEGPFKFPGPVRMFEPQHSNVTWEARPDGNVYFLKGFQVTQTGAAMSNFGTVQCAVIDISNISASDFTLLTNIIFSVDFKRPGDYSVQVRSLPLGSAEPPNSIRISEDPIYEVYHPTVELTLDYKQTNQSCVNISLLILPEVEGATQINIDTLYNGHYLQNLSGSIPYTVWQYIPMCELAIGNYTMKNRDGKTGYIRNVQTSLEEKTCRSFVLISLSDDGGSTNQDKCLCYRGTPEEFTCQPCKTYRRTFHVTKFTQPINICGGSDVNPIKGDHCDEFGIHCDFTVIHYRGEGDAGTVAIAVTCPLVALALMAGLYVLYRRRVKQFPVCWENTQTLSDKDGDKLPTVYLVFSYDNESHTNVVQAFIEMIEVTYSCKVITLNTQNKSSSDVFLMETSMSRDALKECDIIIVIHSEYMHYLVSESNYKQESDKRTTEDICLIRELSEIRSNTWLCQKTISIYFDYTDKAFVNLLSSEILFYLPLQSNKLRNHLVNNTVLVEKTATSECFDNLSKRKEKENDFISAINSTHLYQKFHPKWLTVKLFNMQHSFSSDDSGVILTNQQSRRQRSVRSKSADTVSKCEMHQQLSNCAICKRGKLRRHSFDVSFCPPDTISDDVSVRLSLLESRLVAFNDRYEFIMNNGVHPDDEFDCMTIYQNNV